MKIKKKNLQIAIDGTIAVGKSSLAYALAKELNIIYIYTGVMYRAVAYMAEKNKIALDDSKKILKLIKNKKFEFKKPRQKDRYTDLYFDQVDISKYLFTPNASSGSAIVAQLPLVRQYLVDLQKNMVKGKSVVMEGRDIGQVVLPNADLKIFLTADLDIRVKRRFTQLQAIGKKRSYKKVFDEIKKRDNYDLHRSVSPLCKTDDAFLIDTSKISVAKTITMVIDELKKRNLLE